MKSEKSKRTKLKFKNLVDIQIFYIEHTNSELYDAFRLSRGSSKNNLDSCALVLNIDKKKYNYLSLGWQASWESKLAPNHQGLVVISPRVKLFDQLQDDHTNLNFEIDILLFCAELINFVIQIWDVLNSADQRGPVKFRIKQIFSIPNYVFMTLPMIFQPPF